MTPRPLPDLPGPLAEPLHLLEPSWSLVPWLLFVLVNSLLVAWLRHRYRQHKANRALEPEPEPAPPPRPAPPAPELSEIERKIQHVRLHHRAPGATREGCHQLSELLRDHLTASVAPHHLPPEPESLTGREMGRLFGGAVNGFFVLLTGLEFGRRQPHPGEFETACDLAAEVVRSAPRPKRPWRGRRDGQDAETAP